MVFHGFSWFFQRTGFQRTGSQRTGFQRTGYPLIFIDGLWISINEYKWKSINEYGPFLWAPSFGPHGPLLGPFLWAPWGPGLFGCSFAFVVSDAVWCTFALFCGKFLPACVLFLRSKNCRHMCEKGPKQMSLFSYLFDFRGLLFRRCSETPFRSC